LAFSNPVKRGSKRNQQRYYQPVEIPELRQKTLEVWRQRDEAAKASQQTAEAALKSLSTPDANENMGVESFVLSLNSDLEVGSTGNIYRSPVLPTESAAYQTAAYQDEGVGSELQQLVEALQFAESLEDLASIIEGSPLEAVEDAIALQDSQPRRMQLQGWLEVLNQPVEETKPTRSWQWSDLPAVKSILRWIDRSEQVLLLAIGADGLCQVRSHLTGVVTNTHASQLMPVSG
jgi:hypothetical protein